ncbi:MAG TPA: hypothetical protein VGE74_06080, partial [Gemmata sp.]
AALALGYSASHAPAPPPGPTAEPLPAAPLAPALPDTPFERGLFYARNKQYGFAAVEFQRAAHDGQDGRAYGYLTFCLSNGRDPKGAISAADKAIELGHRTAPVYANRAYNHFQLAHYQETKADCDEALRRDQNLLAARYTRALLRLQMYFQLRVQKIVAGPIPPEAVADIDAVTEAVSNDPDVWVTAAQIYVLAAEGRPEVLDRAARAVRAAVLAGKSPRLIGRNSVFGPIANHPVYKNALELPPVPAPPVANPQIANPIP